MGYGPVDATALALACERFGDGELFGSAVVGQPANAVTSLAFVLAGLLVLAGRRGAAGTRWPYALLVIAVGLGSVVQHGPHPPWQAYAHDLPLASLLGFVAADAAADLGWHRFRRWWAIPDGTAPTVARSMVPVPVVPVPVVAAAMVPVVAVGPVASSAVQGLLAAAAIGLNLVRARVRPGLRRRLYVALGLLATGSLAGTLGERTSLCQPDSLWQGHAVWHLLAAAALWWLAPAIGARHPRAHP